MAHVMLQTLGFDYSINQLDFFNRKIALINLTLLVSFILYMQLHSLEKCQNPQAFAIPMDI